ncbi:serine hydrolase domain-containing protein [Streptomyces sp. SM13]|uniref:serine hydrolase domain-containing protein n=1 Tax=Streptomyces sp. SM13 TaxID=1983803 RepID=UPI0027E54FDE|nr:serine hydrolase domain-containing protein [Streptomyces sp. SM13]
MIFRRSWLSVAVLALAVSSLPSAAASAAPRPSGTGWSVQRYADALRDTGVTGVAVRVETPRGTTEARSGVRDLVTRRPVPRDGYLRLGSTTKTFVATVVLQLAGEKRISLDRSVEELLPGVVSGAGNDGRTITVRDLLQHTSGLSDYVHDVFPDPGARTYSPTGGPRTSPRSWSPWPCAMSPPSRQAPAGSTPTRTTYSPE